MLKHTQTYEIMTPESWASPKTSLVLGKHSGRAALKNKLEEMGYELSDNQFQDVFVRFKALTDRKRPSMTRISRRWSTRSWPRRMSASASSR